MHKKIGCTKWVIKKEWEIVILNIELKSHVIHLQHVIHIHSSN